MRKMISFKIENLPDKQRKVVDEWANGQSNIQQSLANVIMHIVAHTGNADVMDFEVQRKLHSLLNTMTPTPTVVTPAPVQSTPVEVTPVAENKAVPVEEEKVATNDPIAKAAGLFDEE